MKNIYKIFTIILFMFLFNSININAQWQQVNGPFGDNVYSITHSGNTLLAGTSKSVFISQDNGSTWAESKLDLQQNGVISIAVTDSNIYVLAAYQGFYISTNFGLSWLASNNGLYTAVQSLGSLNNNLFIGTWNNQGVFLSTNNGNLWAPINNGLKDAGNIYSFQNIEDKLFIGTSNGVYLTTDNGTNWINKGLNSIEVYSFAESATNILAGTSMGIYRSSNDYSNWTEVNKGIGNKNINLLSSSGNYLFAINDGEIFLSENEGQNWVSVNDGLEKMDIRGINVFNESVFLATAGDGIWKRSLSDMTFIEDTTTDNRSKWIDTKCPVEFGYDIFDFAITGDYLFAATYEDGIFVTTDYGENWFAHNLGLSNKDVRSLVAKDNNLFAGTFGSGVFYSSNYGNSWNKANNGIDSSDVMALAINNYFLFAGTDYGIYRSNNNGGSWEAINSGFPYPRSFITITAKGSSLFAGTYDGIYVSTNNGDNWTAIKSGVGNVAVFSIVAIDSMYFAGTSSGVYCSTDNGNVWTAYNFGLTSLSIRSLAINNSNIFAGEYYDGIFISRDLGKHWADINYDISDHWPILINKLVVKDSFLFAAPAGKVLRRSISGITEVTSINNEVKQPIGFILSQNYPNPFNPTTKIEYSIPKTSFVRLKVYDILGREVAALVDEEKSVGSYNIEFNGSNLSSGIYFYKIQAGDYSLVKKMILIK